MLQRRVGTLRPEFNETVLINQEGFDSKHFRVSEIPEKLTSGKNMFKVYGNRLLLKDNSPILIQVTDINGDPVYHHVNNFTDSEGRVIIGVWVYPDTPPGLGKIEILGIATKRTDGRDIPNNWRNAYNVKYTREIIISPESANTSPIIFQRIPSMKVEEKMREYLTAIHESTVTSIVTQTDGTLDYSYNGTGDAIVTITGGIFSASADGGTLTIPTPGVTLEDGYSLQPGAITEFSSVILGLINNTTARVAPYILDVQSDQTTYIPGPPVPKGSPPNPGTYQISTVNSTFPVSSFGPIAADEYTLEFQQTATYTEGSFNSQSFANITLKNIDPIVGKVHTLKTFMKSQGFANYQLISEDVLHERNIFVDVDSSLAFDSMGDFKNQETINTYWASSSVNQTVNFFNKHDDTVMISSLVITGSDLLNESTDYPNPPLATDPYIMVSSSNGVDIYKDNEYSLKFKVVAEAYPNQEKTSLMDIYISGSNIGASDDRLIGQKLTTLETDPDFVVPDIVSDVTVYKGTSVEAAAGGKISVAGTQVDASINTSKSVPGKFAANTSYTLNVNSSPSVDKRTLELNYTPVLDASAHIVFAVTRGKWYLSDITLEGAAGHGFTPNHTFLEFPISTAQMNDVLDFKFEFYNTAGNIANITLTTQSLDFAGGNVYVTGDNNVISGSFDIGGGIIMKGFGS